MDRLSMDALDFVYVLGDAYIDHPSFGAAIIARVLQSKGFSVGLICQPDWHSVDDFRRLGKNEYEQQDMDIMNIACNKRFFPLGPSYCMSNYLYSLIVNRRKEMEAIYGAEELDHALQAGIVHYNGAKPWNEACMNMDILARQKSISDVWYRPMR